MNENSTVIYGKHAVLEACRMRPDTIGAIYIAPSLDAETRSVLAGFKLPLRELNPKKMPGGLSSDVVHQGIVAEIIIARMMQSYDDFISSLAITKDTALVLLGEVQDPHNVGAVIRSAAAFGIHGILLPEHRQAQVNGTIIKVSAGMAFHLPLVTIGNVNHVVDDLKERGFWIYGLDGAATQSVTDETFEKPSVFVLGNEGEGIRKKTLAHCDIPLRIPMAPTTESLNAAAAAAVVFYAWSVQHPPLPH